MDLIALSGLTVISGHILVASAFGAAIPIVHNDCKDRHGLQSQRRAAVAIVRLCSQAATVPQDDNPLL